MFPFPVYGLGPTPLMLEEQNYLLTQQIQRAYLIILKSLIMTLALNFIPRLKHGVISSHLSSLWIHIGTLELPMHISERHLPLWQRHHLCMLEAQPQTEHCHRVSA